MTAQDIIRALRAASPAELISICRLITMGKNAERAADTPDDKAAYDRGETGHVPNQEGCIGGLRGHNLFLHSMTSDQRAAWESNLR